MLVLTCKELQLSPLLLAFPKSAATKGIRTKGYINNLAEVTAPVSDGFWPTLTPNASG